MEIRGANVLLTGAAGGLGGYMARALASAGANLALSDVAGGGLKTLGEGLEREGRSVVTIEADLTDDGERRGLIDRAEAELGPVDVLVNNAGLEFIGAFTRAPLEEIEAITKVNLLAVMELSRLALPGMLDRRRGHIVNIASLAGKVPAAYFHSYNATKHGVVGFSHALRAELSDTPVGCSVICPGFVSRAGMYGRIEDRLEAPNALGTVLPEKVAGAVLRAVRDDVPEIVVNGRPVRAVIALASVAPGAALRLGELIGAKRAAREFARAEGRL